MRKKGIALIVVLVLVVLFSALILAVVLSATMAIRKAHYYTDKTIALEIAETGIQQILYKMNYEKYGSGSEHLYPFGENLTGTSISAPSIPNYYPPSGTPSTLSYTAYDTDVDVSAYGPEAHCDIRLIDANLNTSDPTSYDTDLDLLISEGRYKGKAVRIMCRIRGANQAGGDLDGTNYNLFSPPRTQGSCGISEAFNKHTIYANTLGPSSISNSVTLLGNICTDNWPSSIDALGEYTYTDTNVSILSVPVLGDDWIPEDPEDSEPTKPTYAWDKKFKDDDGAALYVSYDSTQYETTLPAGVSYSGDGTTETYTIDGASIGDEKWAFEKAASDTLTVVITGTTNMGMNGVVKSEATSGEADIELDFSGSNNPNIAGKLVAEHDIKIENVGVTTPNQIGTSGDITLWAGGVVSIDYMSDEGPTINGDIRGNEINLKCGGNKIIINGNVYGTDKVNFLDNTNTTDGITINGDVIGIGGITFDSNNGGKNTVYSLVTKSSLTIPNNANFSLIIDSTNSERKAGIIIYQDTDATINLAINSDLNITVGDNQVGGIIVYFDGVVNGGTGKKSNITISGNINFTDSENNKFLLINRSEDGSITIDASGKEVNGSIYSAYYKDTTPPITINSGTLTGSIITNGKVNLNGGSVIYNPIPYKNSTGDIYKGFVGGRRVYLPVPGSWRVEW